MADTPSATGTLEVALAHATRLLDTRCARGRCEQAAEILKVIPDQPNALALQGLALGRLGQGDEAIERAAARGASQARAARRLARARRSLHRARDARGRRRRLRAVHPPLDARSEAHGRRRWRWCENRIPEAEGALREHLKRHPTDVAAIRMLAEVAARIGRYRRRGEPAGALPRARAGIRGRAPQLRHGAAPAEQARGRARAGGAAARRRPAQSRLSQSQGRDSRAHRRVRGVHRALPERARGLSEPGQGVDEPGARAQDRGPQRREHRRLSSRASSARRNSARRTGASPISRPSASRRQQTQAMREQLAGAELVGRRPLSLRVLAGQGARGRRRVRGVLRALPRGQSPAPADDSLRRRRESRARRAFEDASSRASSSRSAPAWAARRRIRSSWWACRARAPRSSSRSWRHTRRSRAPWSCPTSRCWRAWSARAPRAPAGSAYPRALEKFSAEELRALGEQYLAQTRIQRKTTGAVLHRQDA